MLLATMQTAEFYAIFILLVVSFLKSLIQLHHILHDHRWEFSFSPILRAAYDPWSWTRASLSAGFYQSISIFHATLAFSIVSALSDKMRHLPMRAF
jgi:hypothetical protein